MNNFIEQAPTPESVWRAIILFGMNTASYKFALGRALLELAQRKQAVILLEELAIPYASEISRHLITADKQTTFHKSQFLDACRKFNQGTISDTEMLSVTLQVGFRYVLDAFHMVNQGRTPIKFYEQIKTNRVKGIVLTDELFKLVDSSQKGNLSYEIEARWRLVETAWELSLSRNVVTIEVVDNATLLVTHDSTLRRVDITSSRAALNGYQKGKCFYCFTDIDLDADADRRSDVDHFFPHTLNQFNVIPQLNGVWNLVLACQQCNRGVQGKFARIPVVRYLERLHRRNEFYINSHHPLRETILLQTGMNEHLRQQFLWKCYLEAKRILIHDWNANNELAPVF